MVLELVPPGRPDEGRGASSGSPASTALEAVLYAGDDLADLDAFAALDRLAARGHAWRSRSPCAATRRPPALVEAADVVVDGPAGLVELLRQLA